MNKLDISDAMVRAHLDLLDRKNIDTTKLKEIYEKKRAILETEDMLKGTGC